MSYRESLAGLVALPGLMDCSLATFGERLAARLREEQAKPNPDTNLIALLCDAGRLGDEVSNGRRHEAQDDGRREAFREAADLVRDAARMAGNDLLFASGIEAELRARATGAGR